MDNRTLRDTRSVNIIYIKPSRSSFAFASQGLTKRDMRDISEFDNQAAARGEVDRKKRGVSKRDQVVPALVLKLLETGFAPSKVNNMLPRGLSGDLLSPWFHAHDTPQTDRL